MKLLVINYAKDVESSVKFYEALGLKLEQEIDAIWTETNADGGIMAVHSRALANFPKSGYEVCMVADEPLEDVQARLTAAGFDGGEIKDEDFGRSLRVIDPDGNELQINEQ